MSVPKKRQTSGRGKRRRAGHKNLATGPYTICEQGHVIARHHVCAHDIAARKNTSQ